MNFLIQKLTHWFLFGPMLMFAAGAVADVTAAPSGDSGAAPSPDTSSTATAAPGETTSTSTETAPNLSDAVKRAVENAEKSLAKPGVPAETTTEAPKAEAAKTGDGTTDPAKAVETANPLDKLGPLPAERITAAFKEFTPEMQEALKEKGLNVEVLTENARLAAETGQYKELLPTLDAAKEALDGAQNYWKIDSGLAEVKDIDSFDKFMTSIAEMTFIRDAGGKPIPDPDRPGAFKNNGALGKMIDYSAVVRDTNLGKLADMLIDAAKDDDSKAKATDLKGALDYIRKFVDNGYKFDGSKIDPKTLPPEVQERLDRADKLERENTEKSTKDQATQYEASENSIIQDTHKALSPMIEEALKGVPLSDKLKANLGKQVWEQVVENMTKNQLYVRQRDTLSRQGNDYNQRRVALNLNYLKPVAARALAELVGEIGKPVVQATQDRHKKIDAQSEAGQMEPKTSGTTLQAHTGVMSAEDIGKKALENARAKNPSAQMGDSTWFAEVSRLKKLPISA